jgi:hypothetical protein
MTFKKAFKREVEVAFSKHAQPVWFRILKYILLACMVYFLWGSILLWILLSIMFIGGLSLHFWYRHQTQGWTRSYGLWDYDKNKPKEEK